MYTSYVTSVTNPLCIANVTPAMNAAGLCATVSIVMNALHSAMIRGDARYVILSM